MPEISAAVGPGAANTPADVRIIQDLLIRHQRWLNGVAAPQATGQFDAATAAAILGFQTDGAALARPDGRVDPRGFTLSRLNLAAIIGPQHRIFQNLCWGHYGDALTAANYAAAATTLSCEAAAIRAVAETEARDEAWDSLGRPIILFERHKFRRWTNGRFDRTHSDISHPDWGGYGRSSAQYGRLRRAAMLDESAALKSASWGLFQILGENHVAAGHGTVDAFVTAMMNSQADHLATFVAFVAADANLSRAIRDKDWTTFARRYNGPEYARNDYDGKMRRAYERLSAPVR